MELINLLMTFGITFVFFSVIYILTFSVERSEPIKEVAKKYEPYVLSLLLSLMISGAAHYAVIQWVSYTL